MKTLSKLPVLLVLICLLVMSAAPALAQSIPEQLQAPERVQGTYQSPTGRTTVSLDAQVVVPGVESLPMVEVFPRVFDPAEARALADLMIGEDQWEAWQCTQDGENPKEARDPSPSPGYHVLSQPWGDNHSICLKSREVNSRGFAVSQVTAGYFVQPLQPELVWHNNLSYHFNGCYNSGRNIGTPEAARTLADPIIRQMFPEMRFHSVDKELLDLPDRCQKGVLPGDYGHRLYYARSLAGVQVTPVCQEGASPTSIDAYSQAIPYETLFVDVGEDGIFRILYKNPLALGNTLQAAPALLPFTQVMDIFSKLAPLKYAASENEQNNGIQVSQVVLGYMQLQMKAQPNRYQLLPVWDFFGTRTIGKERYDFANLSLFTINALDGTVIDRDLGY